MYLDHFHLTKPPFENTPDPFFFLREGQYRDALAAMVYSVASRKGMVAVAGPTGCGKTTLSHVLLEYLPEKTQVISLVHLTARPLELLTLVALELGIHPPPDSPLLLTRALQESLLKRAEADQTVVLTIDEAQALTVDLCQELLLLSNLETHTHKLIQIMLLGRPAFIDLLDHPDLVAFKQRVSMVQRLFPLTGEQTRLYIGHRLSLAGGETRVFTPAALDRIQALSSGIPRLINRVADMALLKAFMADRMEADAGLVDQVGRDLGTGWAGEVIRDVPGRSWPNAGSRLEEPPASASPPRSMEPEGPDELGAAPDSALSTVEPAPVVPTAEADASGPASSSVRPRTAPHITAAHRIPKRSELSPAQVRNGPPPTMAVASKPPSPGADRPSTRRRRYYWWVAAPLILALLALAFWLGMLYQNRAAGEGGRSSRSVQLPETPSSLAEAQAGQTKPAAPVSPPVIGPGSALPLTAPKQFSAPRAVPKTSSVETSTDLPMKLLG